MPAKSVFLFLLVLVNCGSSRAPEQALPTATIHEATGGVIRGKVLFTGTPPKMPVLDMSANPACERMHHSPQRAEQVVVNANGTLRNTFVWIKEGLPKARWNPPAAFATLDQDGCVYKPHVLGIMVGQQLEITNSDTVNHNVHAESTANPSWNETQPPRAEKKMETFETQEVMFPVTCGVHPWMRAYIGVVAHPFFAVTGDDGSFVLKGVPPGTYTVEAVQERYGTKELKVALHPKETKDLEIRYVGDASN